MHDDVICNFVDEMHAICVYSFNFKPFSFLKEQKLVVDDGKNALHDSTTKLDKVRFKMFFSFRYNCYQNLFVRFAMTMQSSLIPFDQNSLTMV